VAAVTQRLRNHARQVDHGAAVVGGGGGVHTGRRSDASALYDVSSLCPTEPERLVRELTMVIW
jgi:hypothetical protein